MVFKNLIIAGVLFFSSFSYSHPSYTANSEQYIVADGVVFLLVEEGWFSNDYYVHRHYTEFSEDTVEILESEYLRIKEYPERFSFYCRIMSDLDAQASECSKYDDRGFAKD